MVFPKLFQFGYRMIIKWSGTVLLATFMIRVQLILPVT